MHPILVLTASLKLISIESVIKRRTKYVHLRQVPDAYLLDIFDNWPDPTRPTNDEIFCDPTQPVDGPDPCPTLVYRSMCELLTVYQR